MVQRNCVLTVDLNEFPTKLLSTFFQFLLENVRHSGFIDDRLPDLHCLVCGQIDSHDEWSHSRFYEALDQSFVCSLQEKAKNLYEFVKEVIAYLLRHPNAHQSFRSFIAENLHCPFCAGKHGIHNAGKHQEWKSLWKIYPLGNSFRSFPEVKIQDPKNTLETSLSSLSQESPISSSIPSEMELQDDCESNLDSYTKWTFELLMNRMPFNIPSFLLGLSNVRSFLDSLITIWKVIRLL